MEHANNKLPHYFGYQYSTITKDSDNPGLDGARRVLIFFLLVGVLPCVFIVLPLYLRHVKYADVIYKVFESDVIQIHDGQSTIFCQKHSLHMNSPFHAFQMKGTPEISNRRKHIRLKKSMSLPDDTIEYWGFYLLRGATVELHACSRYEGSRILIVKGEKILNTCGIMDYHNKIDPGLDKTAQVVVTLESPAELMDVRNNFSESTSHSKDNTAAEESSGELSGPQGFERAQILARDHMNKHKTHHHIKFNMDKGSLQEMHEDTDMTHETGFVQISKKSIRDVGHTPHHLLDQGFNHGGNAYNYTNKATDKDNSMSSFENRLFECYDGNIIISNSFPYNEECKSVQHIEKTTTLKITHNVVVDGYYYYIFFSDNDLVQNDIHTIFDIHKPTFQYANYSHSKSCINKTSCDFPVGFLSGEKVIVEIPTNDGIESDEESWFALTSTCHPRVYVYTIFPIAVLLFILLFSFV